jgi:Ca-activated chloride channel family protein
MTFAQPIWLAAGLLVCVALVWLYYRFDARQRKALSTFASRHLLGQLTASFSTTRRTIKRVLYIAGVACIFIALAQPQWGFRWEEVHRKGIDILFAIDTSKSMLAQDVKPNRITRAKLAVTDLVNKLDGDRVGLIAFAGDAFLQAPLTLDYDAFRQALDAVDVGIVPRGGTNVASAIQEAQAAFGTSTKNEKILVLITDGEDLEAKGIDAARAAAKDELKVYTIGVGSATGDLIPVPDDAGGMTFLKDENGQYVKSHLDENTLKQIAEATGAIYAPLGQQGEGLQEVYQRALAPLPKQDLMSRMEKVNLEQFEWPLSVGIALLLVEMFIGTRKSRYGQRKFVPLPARQGRIAPRRAAVAVLVLAMFGIALGADASPQAAESAYKKGDYEKAEDQYQEAAAKDPQKSALQFNLGAAAYKSGQYDKALPAFQKTLGSDKLDMQAQAYYNLGNTQYRVGQKAEQSQPQQAIKEWQGALASYDGALKLNPADPDAKFNREFVQKKLDELQKQQQQKQQDNKDQQNKDQQNKDQQNKDQQNKDQQNKDQQNKDQQNKDQQNKDQQNKDQQSKDQQSKDQQSSDQQSKDQQSKDQQSKDQQSKDQQSSDQKDQQNGSQSKDQQNQPPQPDKDQDGQDKQSPQLAKNDQKPQPTPGETQPEPSPQPTQGQSEEDTQSQTGEMTPQEARALLDSVKKDEHVLPSAPDARNEQSHQPDQPTKDW